MQTNKNHSVSGQELDNLLKQAFLNLDVTHPKHDAMMETIADNAFSKVAAPVAGTGNSFLSMKMILAGSGLIAVIVAIVYFFTFHNARHEITPGKPHSEETLIRPAKETPETASAITGMDTTHVVPLKVLPAVEIPDAIPQNDLQSQQSSPEPQEHYLPVEQQRKPEDSAYVFPVLTEAEIKANHKQKRRMVEQLMKLHKDRYAFIPMGSFIYGKDTFSCQAFYMQTKEVSNLEYRTFLFDLLIAAKKQDFLKAKPDQEQWSKKFGNEGYPDPMKQMYFSHPAYNDYPVVNISRRGAEMYCIWLSIAVNEALKEKGRPLMNDLRLPMDQEWAYAASNKANQVRYANGTDNLRNSKGLYLQNYNCDTYANSRYDSIHDVYLFQKTENSNGPVTDGGFFTTATGAYAPNLYGIYDLAGNVSEMVYINHYRDRKPSGFGTKGGSWCSPDYFLEIDARQEFRYPEKPSPLVGFRPVMTATIVKSSR